MEKNWQEVIPGQVFSFMSAPCRVDVRYSDQREFSFNYPDEMISVIDPDDPEHPIVNWPHIKDRNGARITHIRFDKR